METERSEHTNRLTAETSPYLLQHAHNPVDWYPWGREALQRAKDEDRLILLSIGYAACHWCHVMERESFEDEETAAFMNERFVNIKVDREERPDLDEIYMAATVAMNNGQGGWPMTVFLTPQLEPVFCGTYFPPSDGLGRPGFKTVLRAVASAWENERQQLRVRAAAITDHLRQRCSSMDPPLSIGDETFRDAVDEYWKAFDAEYGGFGPAPKFPPTQALSLLMRLGQRWPDSRVTKMVVTTLDAMALGGIYDHLGGGFARYSTDRRWLVPHFEKMLYDNALLAGLYLEAFQATGEDRYRRVAAETLDYVRREMTAPEGGFYSSTDADSEGEEGRFFVWTPGEVEDVLGPETAALFNAYYGVTKRGNWEGKNVLHVPRPDRDLADKTGIGLRELRETLDAARAQLYEARLRRTAPATDDKILGSWNGLMIGAFASGFRILGDADCLSAARHAADFVTAALVQENGRVLRTFRAGRAHLDGCLEDYAYIAEGLIDLYEVSGEVSYLRTAERLARRLMSDFTTPGTGAFFSTPAGREALLVRYREGSDGATPAPNAVAGSALARLSYHLGDTDLRDAAVRCIEAYGAAIARFPRAFAKSLIVADFLSVGPVELALVGDRGAEDTIRMRREMARHYLPRRIEAVADPTSCVDDLPLLEGKSAIRGRATLYICRDYVCQAPVTDPVEAAALLRSLGLPGTTHQ